MQRRCTRLPVQARTRNAGMLLRFLVKDWLAHARALCWRTEDLLYCLPSGWLRRLPVLLHFAGCSPQTRLPYCTMSKCGCNVWSGRRISWRICSGCAATSAVLLQPPPLPPARASDLLPALEIVRRLKCMLKSRWAEGRQTRDRRGAGYDLALPPHRTWRALRSEH